MAESAAYFSVKSIGLSSVNGRKPQNLLAAARHNLREIQAEQGEKGGIDPTRTHCNTVVQGPASAAEVQALAGSLLAAAGIDTDKLRRDHCQAIEAVFSLPNGAVTGDGAAYFAQCLGWLGRAMLMPVLSAAIHRDQGARHLHVLLLPVREGVHVGSSPIAREALKHLCTDFFDKVAGPAGLRRTSAKMRGKVKQWAAAAVCRLCEANGLPAANGLLWPALVACIQQDPTPYVLALGIDVNTIRPSDAEPLLNPIGIEANPIGIEKGARKHQSLSCVGIGQPPPFEQATKAPTAPPSEPAITLKRIGQQDDTAGQHQTPSSQPFQSRFKPARGSAVDQAGEDDPTRDHDGVDLPDDMGQTEAQEHDGQADGDATGHTVTDDDGTTRIREHLSERADHNDDMPDEATDSWSPVPARTTNGGKQVNQAPNVQRHMWGSP